MTSIIPPSTSLRQQCRWHAYPNTSLLEHAAAQAIFKASQVAINLHGAFHIVLVGGNTPRHVYELLRTVDTDWHLWHIYFGDERCLPSAHPERNSSMAAQAWLDHVSIPPNQIHIIAAEQHAETAAQDYAQILNNIDRFDLVILGLGEDGHTASLFPEHDWGTSSDAPAALAVHDAPKPPPRRWFGGIVYGKCGRCIRRGAPVMFGKQAGSVAIFAQAQNDQIKTINIVQYLRIILCGCFCMLFCGNDMYLIGRNTHMIQPGLRGHAAVSFRMSRRQAALVSKVDVPQMPVCINSA